MQSEALFSIGEARVMMAVAGAMFAALALRLAWRVVAGVARRHGVAKTAFLFLMSAPLAFWAGGKGGLNCGIMELCNYGNAGLNISTNTPSTFPQSPAPTVSQSAVSPNGREAAPGLHRYFAPSNFVADLSIFTRPTNAVTPSLWLRHSVCDDFREALPDYVAGICGVVTTQPWGIDTPQRIKDCYETYAPFYATNSLIRGVGDFWAVTNENSKTFVWKNLEYNNSPSNLVSFAATIYDWGDFKFTYGNIPDGGFSSFVKLGARTLDMTQYAASGQTVRVEKNLEQDAEWWLENYPEICHTNATGELVFEYDTNEWCFVEFMFCADEPRAPMSKEDTAAAVAKAEAQLRSITNEEILVIRKIAVVSDGPRGDKGHDDQSWWEDDSLDLATNEYMRLVGKYVEHKGWSAVGCEVKFPDPSVSIVGVENGSCTNCYEFMTWDVGKICDYVEQNGIDVGVREIDNFTWLYEQIACQVWWRRVERALAANPFGPEVSVRMFIPVSATVKIQQGEHPTAHEKRFIYAHENTNAVFRQPCRTGYVSYVESTRPLQGFSAGVNETPRCEYGTVAGSYDKEFYYHRAMSLSVEGVAFTNANFTTARAMMTPPVRNGSYTWKASDNIRVRESSSGRYAGLFLENGGGGFVKCVWDNGEHGKWKLCTTGMVEVASCGEAAYTNLTKFLDLRASPSLAVYEDAHLGTNGQPVAATGPLSSSLICSYGGNGAGNMELSQISGTAVTLSDGNNAITLPYMWQVTGGGIEPDRVFNVSNLHVGEVATFKLKFSNDYVPQGIDCQASIRAVTLVVQAGRTWPTERYRHVFGPYEPVAFAVPDYSGEILWSYWGGSAGANPFSTQTPTTPGPVAVTLTVDGSSYSFPISVVGPTIVATNAVPMTDADWMEIGSAPPAVGEIGAGERIYLKLEPDYVSFAGLKTMEGFSPVYNKTGCFEQVIMTNTQHDAAAGAFVVTAVGEENQAGDDRAGFIFTLQGLPPPWSDGGFEFRIPHYWWVDGTTQTNELATCVQRFTLFPNGDSETSKFGWTVHRGTNGVSTVTGPDTSPSQN